MLTDLKAFLEKISEPIAIVKLEDDLLVDCNDWFVKETGVKSKQQLLGKSMDQLFADRKERPRTIKSVVNCEGEDYVLIRLDDHKVKAVVEDKNEDSNRLELIIKTIPDSFFIINRDGLYRDFYAVDKNDNEKSNSKERSLADINLSKKVEIRILANLERGLDSMEPQLFYYDRESEGKLVDFEARIIPLNKNEALLIIRDITELNKSKRDLLEVNDRLRRVLDNVNHIIYDIKIAKDGTQEFQYISPQIEKVYGYTRNEYQKIYKESKELNLFHPDDVESIKKKSKELREEIKPISHTYRFKPKGSEDYIFIQEDVFPKTNEKGKYSGNFGIAKDVTEKVMSERKIQERERALTTLFNHLPGMAYRCAVDDNWTMEVVSTGCLNLTGYKQEDLVGNNKISYGSIIHSEFKNLTANEIVEELENFHEYSFEYKIVTKEGAEKWVWDQGEIIRDEFNQPIALEGYIADLTARKESEQQKIRAEIAEDANIALEEEIKKRIKAQEELAKSKNFTDSIVHSSLDMIMAADRNGKITTISPSAIKAFGYSTKEMINITGDKLYKSPNTHKDVMHQLKSSGQFSGEVENITKDGKVFISYLSASILRDKDGMEIGSMGVSRDITKIKEAEKEIIMQKRKLESIFESSANMMIYTIDKGFKLTSFNKRLFEIMEAQFNTKSKLGINFIQQANEYVKQEHQDRFEKFYRKAVNGEALQFEVPMIRKDGQVVWFENFLSPIVVDGETKEVSCLSHEITDKKMAEWKLKESIAEKDVLLKEVHHRVKNNLQVISSILNLQTSRINDKKTLNIIRESQDRIKSMSFIHESLYQTTNFSSIKFYEYIHNLSRNLVQTYAYEKEIELVTELEQVEVSLDQAIPCGLILNELISNALKYAFTDNPTGTLRISLREMNNEIKIEVEDNGVGIPDDFRVETAESLGLQLVQTLIEQLEGSIDLTSNGGTKYLITFVKQP